MNPRIKISKITRRIGVWRFSAVELLCSLVLFIVMIPFVEDIPNAAFLEPVMLTVVLVAGLLAVGGRRHILWVGLALMEAVNGILYAAVLISRLVSLYSPLVTESDKES